MATDCEPGMPFEPIDPGGTAGTAGGPPEEAGTWASGAGVAATDWVGAAVGAALLSLLELELGAGVLSAPDEASGWALARADGATSATSDGGGASEGGAAAASVPARNASAL